MADDKVVFLDREIDFESVQPYSLHIRDIDAQPYKWQNAEDSVINVLAMIVEADKQFELLFRFRFPGGNKQVYRSKKSSASELLEMLNSTIAATCIHLKSKVLKEHDYTLPAKARISQAGFMEFLRDTNEFDMFVAKQN